MPHRDEDDSEVTRLGTLIAPAGVPMTAQPGQAETGVGERSERFCSRTGLRCNRLHGWLVTLPNILTSKLLCRHKSCSTQ